MANMVVGFACSNQFFPAISAKSRNFAKMPQGLTNDPFQKIRETLTRPIYMSATNRWLTISLCIVPFVFVTNAVGQDDDSIRSRIDEYLSKSVENGFSGAVLVARQGNVVLDKGYGFANKSKQTAIDSTTIFDVGSVTKQFTAAAILKLVQQEELETSDSIDKFFDDLPNDKKNITVHQLLTHTAGLVDSFGDGDFDHLAQDAFFDSLFSAKLLHQPGGKHEYSNCGYSVLARIIEKVSGQEYEEFLNEQLFQPLEMKQTGYLLPQWREECFAQGYQQNVVERGTTIERYREDGKVSWHLKGNGGINSTQTDMFKWYLAIKSGQILPQQLAELWTTPFVAEQASATSHYAYGWAIFKSKRDTKIVSHNGSNGVFFHDFLWLPEEDVVVIFSSNAYSGRIENVAWQVEKMVFDSGYQPEPISKNPYFLISDFVKRHPPEKAAELFDLIQNEYARDFENSEVLNRMGYIMLRSGEDKAWTVEVFQMNSRLFPEDANVWDSLGDGYLAAGKKADAIAAFSKAVKLGNQNTSQKLNQLLDDRSPL